MSVRASRVVVTVEQVFDCTPDGTVWSNGPFTRAFWERYRGQFQEVLVVARVRCVREQPDRAHALNGAGIAFLGLPPYSGVAQFVGAIPAIFRLCRTALRPTDAVILRVPSPIASCVLSFVPGTRPYAVEVVGDIHEVLARGTFKHRLRPLLQWALTWEQRRQCRRAAAAAYVTRHLLQERYPCCEYSISVSDVQLAREALTNRAYVTHYSSVELSAEAFVSRRPTTNERCRLITIGSLAQLYKGTDVLLCALAQCVRDGLDLTLAIVGDGKYRGELEALAERLGIRERVTFVGQLHSMEAVRGQLDAADLFVLPSKTEGLPRALVEAMARSLPCIGSSVGGIPELLAQEDLVKPGSVLGLALKIGEMARSVDRMCAAARRNYDTAQNYRDEQLRLKREGFYQEVRRATEAWVNSTERRVHPSAMTA